jgi:hypothetical protein
MQLVNTDNWTFCRYLSDNFLAMISFGADPESMKEDRLQYYVTVLEDEEKEVFQQTFDSLSEACVFLNENYSDWTFEDQTAATKSGCSSCAAH